MIFKILQVSAQLAYRNIVHNWVNSLLTILILSAIFLNLAFVPSLLTGFSKTVEKQSIETVQGEIILSPGDDKEIIEDTENYKEELKEYESISAVTEVYKLPSELEYEGSSGAFEVNAVNLNDFNDVFVIPDRIIAGRFLEPGDSGKMVLGSQIAPQGDKDSELYQLSLKEVGVGDIVTLNTTDGRSFEYEVVGIYDADYIEADLKAFISKSDLNFEPKVKDKATSINIVTDDLNNDEITELSDELEDRFEDLTVYSWRDLSGMEKSITQSFDLIESIILSIGIFVAIFTIFTVTQVDLTSKRRQIGVLRALGVSGEVIVLNYMLRSGFMTIIAILVGYFLLITAVAPYITINPITFPFGESVLYIQESDLIGISFMMLLASLFSSFLPSMISMNKNITDEIRAA